MRPRAVLLDSRAIMRRIMLSETHNKVWSGAYNAALTGLLAANTNVRQYPQDKIQDISRVCINFADQAIKDAKEHYKKKGKS